MRQDQSWTWVGKASSTPTLLSVNKESRTEILKLYDQPFKEVYETTPLVYGTISIVKGLYFNCVYDTVYINVEWSYLVSTRV
jgi:hypothetical protein